MKKISYPFIRPFIGVITPYITGMGPCCGYDSDLSVLVDFCWLFGAAFMLVHSVELTAKPERWWLGNYFPFGARPIFTTYISFREDICL